jgi:hypothetical protein
MTTKTHGIAISLLLGVLTCLLAGCKSPDAEYGDFGILMFGLASYPITGVVNGYDTAKSGLMPHVHAAPGTTCADFQAAICKAEKINSVPAEFGPGPTFATDHIYLFRYEGRTTIYDGRFVKLANDPSDPAQTLSPGDLTNLPSFLARLQTPTNPIDAYLLSHFSETNRHSIAQLPASALDETTNTIEPILIPELNVIILGPSIYDAARFHDVILRPTTLRLVHFSLNPRPETSLRRQQLLPVLNRRLLADAYPANLPVKPWLPMQNFVAITY